MKVRENRRSGAATARIDAARHRGLRALLFAAAATVSLAAFPAFAGAVTLAPLLGPVSATPTSTGATLRATIYPYGADTHYRFEYGKTTAYGTKVPVPDGDAGSAAYPATVSEVETISGLESGTTYHYRLLASNSLGSATGPEAADKTFTTTSTPPTVADDPASPIAGGFNLGGTVNPAGTATSYRFEYGTTTAYGTNAPVPDASAGSGSADVPVSQDLTGLLPNTTYHFRLSATHSGDPAVVTADRTFTTPPSGPAPPSAVVAAPIAAAGGFELEGTINPNGVATHYHFEFGETTAYGQNLPETDVDIGSGEIGVPVHQEVTGLQPNATYHYKVVAGNTEGPGESGDETFTTPPDPPLVTATPFSESAAGWSLNGTVNPNGGDTTYHFQFGITAAYGSNVPATDADAGSGTSPVAITQLVASLPPGVPYHYRLVAHNAGGTSTSNDEEFVTPSVPSPEGSQPPPVALIPPPPLPAAQATPSSKFALKAPVVKGAAAKLQVTLPGAGKVSASGKGLKTASATAAGPGVVTLKLALTGAGTARLQQAPGHKLAVKVKVAFQPTGGTPGTASKTVVFKLAKT